VRPYNATRRLDIWCIICMNEEDTKEYCKQKELTNIHHDIINIEVEY
jgi:hypothetical protein